MPCAILSLGPSVDPPRPLKRQRLGHSHLDPSLVPQAEPDSLLARLQALDPAEAHAAEDPQDRTIVSGGEDGQAEEGLTWDGLSAVWSVGGAVKRSFTFEHHAPIDQCLFAHFPPLAITSSASRKGKERDKSIYGPFAQTEPPPWPVASTSSSRSAKPSTAQLAASKRPRRAIVILLQDLIYVHFVDTGADHHIHLPFSLRRKGAWALEPTGIVLERMPDLADQSTSSGTVPTLYSLSDPLDELRIVAVADAAPEDGSMRQSVLAGTCQHRAFSSLQETLLIVDHTAPSSSRIAISLDRARAKLSIWRYTFVSDADQEREQGRRLREKDVREARTTRSTAQPRQMTAAETLANAMSRGPGVSAELGQFGIDPASAPAQPLRASVGDRSLREDRRVSMSRGALGMGGGGAELDREASLLLTTTAGAQTLAADAGDVPITSVMRSEIFAEPLHEIVLPFEATLSSAEAEAALRDLQAVLFDRRGDKVLLAILVPCRQSVLLYQLDTTVGTITQSPTVLSATHIAAINATRHTGQKDLLVLSPTSELQLYTANAARFPLDSAQVGPIKELRRAVGSCVDLIAADGRSHRVSLEQKPRDTLAKHMLEVLSGVLSLQSFLAVLDVCTSEPDIRTVLDAIACIVDESIGRDDPAGSQSSPSAFEKIKQRQALKCDRAFKRFRSPGSDTYELEPPTDGQNWPKLSAQDVQAVLLALHMLSESNKLLTARHLDGMRMVKLLARIATRIGFVDWMDYYSRMGFPMPPIKSYSIARQIGGPPDLSDLLSSRLVPRRPIQLNGIQAIALGLGVTPSGFYGDEIDPCAIAGQLATVYDAFKSNADPRPPALDCARDVIVAMHSLGWTAVDIDALSFNYALPLREVMRVCQGSPPSDWSAEAYLLIDRPDLARQLGSRQLTRLRRHRSPPPKASSAKNIAAEKLVPMNKVALQFSTDTRVEDVAKMLQSHTQTTIKMADRPELRRVGQTNSSVLTRISEQQIQSEQQALVLALSGRTLALQIGNAMFNFRTDRVTPTEAARVPSLNLSAKVLPTNASLSIDMNTLAADRRGWPEFHAGVGAALKMIGKPGDFDSTQITFQKGNDLDARFAGFMLGLGLTGHIRSMAVVQAFQYLDPKHEYTSIGVLLGLAAAYVGTGDPKVTSLLSVHLTALHPTGSSTLNLGLATQTAGLLGIGLLYLGSGQRRFSNVMLRELARMTVMGTEHPDGCREAYTLAAGLSFGMIMLERGKTSDALVDVEMLRIFRGLIAGDGQHALPGTREARQAVDVVVTSPAATAALCLMYLDSNRQDVVDLLEIPQNRGRLDYVRPDLLLIRTMTRCMIMRASIRTSSQWVESQVPAFVRVAMQEKRPIADMELTYWHIVAGACLAIAFKYAGSANRSVHVTLISYLDRLLRMDGPKRAYEEFALD